MTRPTAHPSEIPICFLDFDGVLHPDDAYYLPNRGIQMLAPGHRLFEWAGILAEIISHHPPIRIVLSTSWVPMRSFTYAKSRLPIELQQRVIGATYHSREMYKNEFLLMSRGEQVSRYINAHSLTRWCAIDDDGDGWPAKCRSRLIQTDSNTGLSNENIQNQVRSIFACL